MRRNRIINRLELLRQLHGDKWRDNLKDYRDHFKFRGKPELQKWVDPETNEVTQSHNSQLTKQPKAEYGCKVLYWVENVDAIGLRRVGWADEINRHIQHKGWYTDNPPFQDDTIRGVVYQLPTPRRILRHKGWNNAGKRILAREPVEGRERFVYGYDDPNNDGAALLCFDFDVDDKEQAARYADQLTEKVAEDEREFRAKDEADNRKTEIGSEIKELRTERRKIMRELKAVKHYGVLYPNICHAIERRLAAIKAETTKLYEERQKLEDNFWTIVPNY